MSIGIHTIQLGYDQCYVLAGDGVVVVDLGYNLSRHPQEAFTPLIRVPAETVDIILDDGGLDLAGLG